MNHLCPSSLGESGRIIVRFCYSNKGQSIGLPAEAWERWGRSWFREEDPWNQINLSFWHLSFLATGNSRCTLQSHMEKCARELVCQLHIRNISWKGEDCPGFSPVAPVSISVLIELKNVNSQIRSSGLDKMTCVMIPLMRSSLTSTFFYFIT